MQYLMDTHVLLWFMNGDRNLSTDNINRIKDERNDCYISIASIWEIVIKCNVGKLQMKIAFDEIIGFLSENEIEILPVEFNHLRLLLNLELIHRDPFDRMIIAQGITQNLIILTRDENFRHYPVKCLW